MTTWVRRFDGIGMNDVPAVGGRNASLGESVVQGTVNPDEFYVFKPTLAKGFRPILQKQLGTLEQLQQGEVLVTEMTDWEPVMKRAAAVVTDRGGRLFDECSEAVTRTTAQGASEPAREATQAPAAQATGTAREAVASRTTR